MRTSTAALLYALIMGLCLGTVDYIYARQISFAITPASSGEHGLRDRAAWYRDHANEIDVLYLGDSKAYCGIHAELLDRLLGTRSLNLATFANWLPTQLALIKDIAPLIPKGTTVVWSVGQINFLRQDSVPRVYPINIAGALRYRLMGMPFSASFDNVAYFNAAIHFLAVRGEIRQRFLAWMGEGRATPAPSPRQPDLTEAQRIAEAYRADGEISSVGIVADAGRATSLVAYFKRGSYYRVELDSEYFRRKQRETGPVAKIAPPIDPVSWRIFKEALAIFSANGVRLVVNELEEAPFIYASAAVHDEIRATMRETVEPAVRSYGFDYVRVDFDRLTDADYFDYNHMNSRGAETFIPMLAEKLKPLLSQRSG